MNIFIKYVHPYILVTDKAARILQPYPGRSMCFLKGAPIKTLFFPVVVELGIDPVHFRIIIVMNLCIGICTPLVGTLLFMGINIAETTIEKFIHPLMPLFFALLAALLLVTFWEVLSMWLPRLFDLM